MKRLLLIVSVFMLPTLVLAHNPRAEFEDWSDLETPYVIEDATVSFAMFGYLGEDDVDVFRFDYPEADPLLRMKMFIPVCGEHYEDFYADYVLLDPLQETDEAYAELELPFELNDEMGGIIFASERPIVDEETERLSAFERHTRRVYYEAVRDELSLPQAGSYYLIVYNADAMSGDYLLSFGIKEVFFPPLDSEPEGVETNYNRYWIHRDCDLLPDDPNAVIRVDD